MALIRVRRSPNEESEDVSTENPFPVSIENRSDDAGKLIATAERLGIILPYARYNATKPTRADGQLGPLQAEANGTLAVSLNGKTTAAGDTPLTVITANADMVSSDKILETAAGLYAYDGTNPVALNAVSRYPASSQTGTRALAVGPVLYNGTTFDATYNNTQGTLLASAARVASTSSADQTNYNACGVAIFVNTTAVPTIETLLLTIDAKDPVSGNYSTILQSATWTTTGTRYAVLYPGATDSGSRTFVKNELPLPRTWRITMTHSASGSWTYSVGYALIN